MAKKGKNITINEGLPGWVMTYGDMMSLLLCFFVLIVSFSTMQEVKFQQAIQSIRTAFGIMVSPDSVIEMNTPIVANNEPREIDDLLVEVRELEQSLQVEGLEQHIEVEVTQEGVLFRINAPFLFESGSAQVRAAILPVLGKLARFVNKFSYPLRIEGHTDSLPIETNRFPSNWDLSAARAVSVARYFQQVGVTPDRMAAAGYGEFRPLADNNTAGGRSRNRRVEILLKMDQKLRPVSKSLPLAPVRPIRDSDIIGLPTLAKPADGDGDLAHEDR